MTTRLLFRVFAILLVVAVICPPALATAPVIEGSKFARNASDSLLPFLALGEITLFSNGERGRHATEQGAKALVTTCLAVELLKDTVREKRPNDPDAHTSFPSGHAAESFAMATLLSDYDRRYTVPAYAVAGVIGWSRVETNSHHWWDVAAGALLGHYVAKQFTGSHAIFTGDGVGLQWKW